MLTLVQTLLQRANKVKESKKDDALWSSSLQSKLITCRNREYAEGSIMRKAMPFLLVV